MTTLLLVIAAIVLCIILSAFFSSSEMACSSANRLRLENARDDGSKRAGVAVRILDRFESALSAILIGNNLVNIAASSLSSVFVILLTGSDAKTWIATLTVTVLIIIFGETIPKIRAKKQATTLAERYAYVIRALMILFAPLIRLVVWLIGLITRRMKDEEEETPDEAVETLSSIIETAENEDVIDEDQSELVQAAIDFSDISAFETITARVDMLAIDIDDPEDEIAALIDTSPYSRLPVYRDSIDNVIGVLSLNRYLKALADGHADIESLLMPPVYVYKTMKLPTVLNRLRKAKQHLAIVSDEYGGTLGVISMEDVLEQIVGDIWDETDTVEPEVIERESGSWEIDGDMVISDFLELTGLPEDEFEADSETVGGWTVESLGTFPSAGDSFTYGPVTVTVLSVDGRRVEKVLVKNEETPGEET